MRPLTSALLVAPTLALALAPALRAQAQPVQINWSDRWNSLYHRFDDLNGDGVFTVGEVAIHVDPTHPASDRVNSLVTVEEGGVLANYFLKEVGNTIYRGVDIDADGQLEAGEITTFRDVPALDGTAIAKALDVTDDGAVWYAAGVALANDVLGLVRLEDLNADGDANDVGESVQLVDGGAPHPFEHDLGTATTEAWAIWEVASAGDGVIVYNGDDDQALFRYEDLNDDGDVLDAGESVLFLNATGERADLPQNPDFADGTLPDLNTQAGFPATTGYLATTLENGVRAYYLGTVVGPGDSGSSVNLSGDAVNFLIFRAVDLNNDRDVNDAGEVTLWFDGSSDSGLDYLLLRGMDALDGGTVYVVSTMAYPALFPGPEGNTWIHRFEDYDNDGDAMDAGEQLTGVFNGQQHGSGPIFPILPNFGSFMTDPFDFSVRRLTAWTDLGGASAGSNGTPTLSGTGTLVGGTPATVDLVNANPGALMLSWLAFSATPTPALGGTVYPIPFATQRFWVANGAGELSVGLTWPAGLPPGTDAYLQFILEDNGVLFGLSVSNAVKLTTP